MLFLKENKVLISKLFRFIVGLGNMCLAIFVAGPAEWSVVAKLMLLISLPTWILVSPLELHFAQTKERLNSVFGIIILLSLASSIVGIISYQFSYLKAFGILVLSIVQVFSMRKEFIILSLDCHKKFRRVLLTTSLLSLFVKYALIKLNLIWFIVFCTVFERFISVMVFHVDSSDRSVSFQKLSNSVKVGFFGFLSHRLDFMLLSILGNDFLIGLFSIFMRFGELINQIISSYFYKVDKSIKLRSFFIGSISLLVVTSIIVSFYLDLGYVLLIIKLWLIIFGSFWYWSSLKRNLFVVIQQAQIISIILLLVVYISSHFVNVHVLLLGLCGIVGQYYGYIRYEKSIS